MSVYAGPLFYLLIANDNLHQFLFLDPSLSRFVEQKVSIQLDNQWISDYDNTASAKYITLITAINLAVSICLKVNFILIKTKKVYPKPKEANYCLMVLLKKKTCSVSNLPPFLSLSLSTPPPQSLSLPFLFLIFSLIFIHKKIVKVALICPLYKEAKYTHLISEKYEI